MNQGTTILTLNNGYHLFSRKVGEGPIKLLCVHGGPGGTHEGFENFAPYLNDMGVEVYMYDQLGSYHSDQPDFSKEENRHFLTTISASLRKSVRRWDLKTSICWAIPGADCWRRNTP